MRIKGNNLALHGLLVLALIALCIQISPNRFLVVIEFMDVRSWTRVGWFVATTITLLALLLMRKLPDWAFGVRSTRDQSIFAASADTEG